MDALPGSWSDPAPGWGLRPNSDAYERELARRRAAEDREKVARDAAGIRERCKSLIGFVREFWSVIEPTREFVCGWAIEAIALHLEAVTRGDIQYLLINVPPGMMKSLLVAVFWPAWEWGPMGMAGTGYLTSSFGLDNVLRDNNKMRRLVESEKYQALWGDRCAPGSKWGEKRFENVSLGVRAGRSFEKMTGGRGDRVVVDDPHDVDGAESETQRESTIRTFREAIPDRLNDMRRSAIVIIMQRLHANDVSGTIIKLGLPYTHLRLPMEFESTREENGKQVDNRCRTYLKKDIGPDGKPLPGATPFFVDPRTEDGELLFPERFPEEVVEGLKIAKGSYAYAGQYQQRPSAREGGLFKRAWFAGKILDGQKLKGLHFTRCRAHDFAATAASAINADPDWTAEALIGRRGTDYYVFHVSRRRDSPGMVLNHVKVRGETDPAGTVQRIPVDPGQAGIFQADQYVKAMPGVNLKAVSTQGRGNKVARAQPFAIQAEFGHVYLVNSGPPDEGVDPWIEPYLDELCTFPTGSHDDMVDASSDAFEEVAAMPSGQIETASSGRRDVIGATERDRRYQFGDKPAKENGSGWGSAPSVTRVM